MEFELWVRLIKESIEKKNIKPWDINISEVADEYIKTIKTLKKFDIRLSADVILVGGILLRMKSQQLYGDCEEAFFEEEGEESGEGDNLTEDTDYEDYDDSITYEKDTEITNDNNIDDTTSTTIDEVIRDNKGKKKKKERKNLTFSDLINALKYELNKLKRKSAYGRDVKSESIDSENLVYDLVADMEEEVDISDLIEDLMTELSKEGIIIFQNKFSSKRDKIRYLLPSLYLANDKKIDIYQGKIFEDIVLKLKE